MFILDTNVISEIGKPKANPNVLAWAARTPQQTTFLSAITILEIELGVLLMERKDKERATRLRSWINTIVWPAYTDRILAIDAGVARCCATLHVPKRRPDRDTFIAATAITHGMTVVTRNVADFQIDGLKVINPWD